MNELEKIFRDPELIFLLESELGPIKRIDIDSHLVRITTQKHTIEITLQEIAQALSQNH